jgi:NADH-quinone oxidoreductase subunit E
MLRGSEALIEICKERIAEHPHELSKDGRFSWEEVECLGCCSNAPVVQIGKVVFEDLDPELFEKLLYALRQGKPVKPGSQTGRKASCPAGGATSLKDVIDKVAEKV